jgi:hypothetical protein
MPLTHPHERSHKSDHRAWRIPSALSRLAGNLYRPSVTIACTGFAAWPPAFSVRRNVRRASLKPFRVHGVSHRKRSAHDRLTPHRFNKRATGKKPNNARVARCEDRQLKRFTTPQCRIALRDSLPRSTCAAVTRRRHARSRGRVLQSRTVASRHRSHVSRPSVVRPAPRGPCAIVAASSHGPPVAQIQEEDSLR